MTVESLLEKSTQVCAAQVFSLHLLKPCVRNWVMILEVGVERAIPGLLAELCDAVLWVFFV